MAEKWIAKAIKRPGALTAAAKRSGAYSSSKGTINKSWIRSQAGSGNPRRAAQAQLALNLAKMRAKKK